MPNASFIVALAILAFAIGILHVVALTFFLYWSLPWFDVLLHFLGGMWIAALAFWFLFIYKLIPSIPRTRGAALVFVFGATLLVGIAWEIFEYVTGNFFAENYRFDTTVDLIVDMGGAITAYVAIIHSRYRSMLEWPNV